MLKMQTKYKHCCVKIEETTSIAYEYTINKKKIFNTNALKRNFKKNINNIRFQLKHLKYMNFIFIFKLFTKYSMFFAVVNFYHHRLEQVIKI